MRTVSRHLGHCRPAALLGYLILFAGAGGCRAASGHEPAAERVIDLLPLIEGAQWRYRVTDGAGHSGERTAVVEGRAYEGCGAEGTFFRVRQELLDVTVVRCEARTRTGVVCGQEEVQDRFGMVADEETFDPPALVVDERPAQLVPGRMWTEAFADTEPNFRGRPRTKRVTVKWSVESTDDRVAVPAGTFTCVRVRSERKHYGAITSWYAPNVGLVKQVGAGPLGDQALALVDAHLP